LYCYAVGRCDAKRSLNLNRKHSLNRLHGIGSLSPISHVHRSIHSDKSIVHFVIERLNRLIEIPRAHVGMQNFCFLRSKSFGIYDRQVELAAIRVGKGDIGCVTHQILVNKQPLDFSHGVLVACCNILILDLESHCHVVISRILNVPRLYVVVLVFGKV